MRLVVVAAGLVCLLATIWGMTFAVSVASTDSPGGDVIVEQLTGESADWRPIFAEISKSRNLVHDHEQAADTARSTFGLRQGPELDCASEGATAMGRGGFTHISGFFDIRDDYREAALGRACGHFDAAMPDWFVLTPDGTGWAMPEQYPEQLADSPLMQSRERYALTPLVRLEEFDPTGSDVLADPRFIQSVAFDLAAHVEAQAFEGLCLDVGDLEWGGMMQVGGLLTALRQHVAPARFETCVVTYSDAVESIPPDTLDMLDRVIVRMFRPHFADMIETPRAPREWFDYEMRRVAEVVPAPKLVVAIGAGGLSWIAGESGPQPVDHAEIMRRLHHFGGYALFPDRPRNPMVTFVNAAGQNERIWYLDAATAYNQLRLARELGVSRVAIWGVGREDPSLWPMLQATALEPETAGKALEVVNLSDSVRYTGSGPFHDFETDPVPGDRAVQFDPDSGEIASESFRTAPVPYIVRRWGRPESKMVAITFDDGPDEKYTSQVLDVLRDAEVQATFFPIGVNMLSNRGLIRRMVDEGHIVGLHTFTHPHIEDATDFRLKQELQMQGRLTATLTGKRPLLFRPPYVDGPGPDTGRLAEKMSKLDDLGYITIGSDIVPHDWVWKDPQRIADFVIDEVRASPEQGQVLLIHDAGGNREATVQALSIIIATLQAEGVSFVNAADFMGVTSEQLMPDVRGARTTFETISLFTLIYIWQFARMMFWLVIAFAIFRVSLVLFLCLRRGRHAVVHEGYAPSVTVIVPAYNEENVIVSSVNNILQSTYGNFDVIVVNDGSTDNTLKIARSKFRRNPRVKVYTQRNQGKWAAANKGFARSDSEIVVAIDADTILAPDAIGHLVQKMKDPRVGAVAGKVIVGNQRNLLTRFQAIEYLVGQNVDRRAYEALNAIMVVPGAIGAWRRDAVIEAGLYSPETMTEDADLTVSLIRAGYRVEYDERALCYTEAPETVKAFLAQRLRWTLGKLQTAWKHRGAVRERRSVGLAAIPDQIVSGMLLPLFAPIVDLVAIIAVLNLTTTLFYGLPYATDSSPGLMLLGYAVMPLTELLVAVLAMRYEAKRDWKLLLYWPLQRVAYRILMMWTVYRALSRAVTGKLASWQKARRTANVTTSFAAAKPAS
ncbi:glycosyltransferase [Vannielia litorea]|uniref:glycosyltransferase n=1 Tax=Vannielia litorea TaxID=1217970 RepID=UPI001BCBA1F5|nr:glycosyltransferase [Vannielia litorea]